MNRTSIKLGYWTAIICVILAICYSFGLTILFIVSPLPAWTNLANFVETVKPISLISMIVCQVIAFILSPISLILCCTYYDYASVDKKIFVRIGVCAKIAAMVLGCQSYFLHFNSMRQIFSKGIIIGFDQFIEWNPTSVVTMSGGLGWTFFAGMASLFISFIFSGGRLEKWIKYMGLVGGISYIVGMFGLLFENRLLQLIYFGGALLSGIITGILIVVLYKRLNNEASSEVLKSDTNLSA